MQQDNYVKMIELIDLEIEDYRKVIQDIDRAYHSAEIGYYQSEEAKTPYRVTFRDFMGVCRCEDFETYEQARDFALGHVPYTIVDTHIELLDMWKKEKEDKIFPYDVKLKALYEVRSIFASRLDEEHRKEIIFYR